MKTLFLSSPTLKDRINIDLTQGPAKLAETKKNPSEYPRGSQLELYPWSARPETDMAVTIKEGVEYSVGVTFSSVPAPIVVLGYGRN